MRLSTSDVRKVAALAKLEVAEVDIETMSKKLLSVLEFVEQLSRVDTANVEEMSHPVDLHTVLRPDHLQPGLTHEAALGNAPRTDGEYFLVPPVLG